MKARCSTTHISWPTQPIEPAPWTPIGLLPKVGRLYAPSCLQGHEDQLTKDQKWHFVAGFVVGHMGASREEALSAVGAIVTASSPVAVLNDSAPLTVEDSWEETLNGEWRNSSFESFANVVHQVVLVARILHNHFRPYEFLFPHRTNRIIGENEHPNVGAEPNERITLL